MNISHRMQPFYIYGLPFFLATTIAATLTTSSVFIYKSLTPQLLYSACIVVFIALTSVLLFVEKTKKNKLGPPILIILIWTLYILSNGVFVTKFFSPFHIYLILNCGFFIAIYCVVRVTEFRPTMLFTAITGIALVESIICVSQYFGLSPSSNHYFVVTGTWENPNVTAMFIAMATPSAFSLYLQPQKLLKTTATVCILTFFVTILLLQCRTALIGGIVALGILYNSKYALIQRVKQSSNRSGKIVLILVSFAIITFFGNYMYLLKKTSADGRQLIWKLSTKMILDKPICGYGYGLFARNYNLFQSRYFEKGNGDLNEAQQAGFVHMGYNEFLENTAEGGLPGLVIISMFFMILLLPGPRDNNVDSHKKGLPVSNATIKNLDIVTYAGISAFVIMSVFNFTFQAIPAMCLFIIYAAIYSAGLNDDLKWQLITIKSGVKWAFATGLMILGVALGLRITNVFHTELLIKQAQVQAQNNNAEQAIDILKSIGTKSNLFEDFYFVYGDILLGQKNFAGALVNYNKAITYTSDPEIYMKAAFCYQQTGQYQKAENNYLVAEYIEPNRLKARSALMGMYRQIKDSTKAIAMAREIIAIVPRIPSAKARREQQSAYMLLKEFHAPLPASPLFTNRATIVNYNLNR